jgi:hypothetical protein
MEGKEKKKVRTLEKRPRKIDKEGQTNLFTGCVHRHIGVGIGGLGCCRRRSRSGGRGRGGFGSWGSGSCCGSCGRLVSHFLKAAKKKKKDGREKTGVRNETETVWTTHKSNIKFDLWKGGYGVYWKSKERKTREREILYKVYFFLKVYSFLFVHSFISSCEFTYSCFDWLFLIFLACQRIYEIMIWLTQHGEAVSGWAFLHILFFSFLCLSSCLLFRLKL